jgi:hypothetical protein
MYSGTTPRSSLDTYSVPRTFAIPLIGIFCSVLSSCSSSAPVASEDPKQGAGFYFRPGYPEIRVTAIGLYDLDGEPGVDVIVDIVYGSLVYNKKDDLFHAKLLLDVRLIQENVPIPKVYSQSFEFYVSDNRGFIKNIQE